MIRIDSLGPLRVAVRTVLARSPDLLKLEYQLQQSTGASPMTGHCYVASEVAYHLLGGPEGPWVPATVRHEGAVHWYLRCRDSGAILDLTADQFATPVPYEAGRGRGFLTAEPSARACEALRRLAALPADSSSPDTSRWVRWRPGAA